MLYKIKVCTLLSLSVYPRQSVIALVTIAVLRYFNDIYLT